MTLIVLSAYPHRVEANSHHWGTFTVFNPGLVGLREAHLDLAIAAVKHCWDETVHIIQDDVTDITRGGPHYGDITSYHPSQTGQHGPMRHADHVCPKSFTATRAGWTRLTTEWARPGKTCELWTPDYVHPEVPK